VICLHLVFSLFMSGARPCHFVCEVILLLVFHGFIIVYFLSCLLCFEGLGNWFGNEQVK